MIKSAIIGGITGLIIMFILMMNGPMAPSRWLLLWPSCIFGFGYNGQGGMDGVLVWSLEIGVQFLVYAAIGLGIRSLVQKVRKVA